MNLRDRENRKFGFIMSFVFIVIGSYQWYKHYYFFTAFLILGVILLVIATINPMLLKAPRRAWEWLSIILGEVNTRIIFTLLYFLIFTPFGLIFRICRYDPLQQKIKVDQPSYWQFSHEEKISSLQNQF